MDERERRRKKRKKQQQMALIIKCVIFVVLIVILIFAIKFVIGMNKKDDTISKSKSKETSELSQGSSTQSAATNVENILNQARFMAVQYNYDGALELLKTVDKYDENADIISLMADLETQKSSLVATAPDKVTHIFFHSLVVDPARAFSITDSESWNNATAGFCQWMTTIPEFNAIMQQMYDRGYVLVSLNDLIDKTIDESGTVHITAKNIYLPEGKTPFVLSLDDLCYYHSYDGRGCATRMIVGENGKPTCEYVDANGNGSVGSYDCVPLLDDFLNQHPDFSYKGAKGTIALTGYNGILGYRTDYCYRDRVDLTSDQEAWLNANPSFDWNAECAKAKEVAECIKNDGWTFASHTWGHIRVGDATMESLQADTEKWDNYVRPLIGDTDMIIFAHGQDLAAWNDDYAQAEKFQYLHSKGFNIFCNVDSSKYFVQIGDQFLRMGRRNLDGYRLYWSINGENKVDDLCDPNTVIDPARPRDESLYDL